MRTTLTLDPDVAAEIRRLRDRERRSLSGLINELLRLGLKARRAPKPADGGTPFRTRAVRLGAPLTPLDDVTAVLTAGEGEDCR